MSRVYFEHGLDEFQQLFGQLEQQLQDDVDKAVSEIDGVLESNLHGKPYCLSWMKDEGGNICHVPFINNEHFRLCYLQIVPDVWIAYHVEEFNIARVTSKCDLLVARMVFRHEPTFACVRMLMPFSKSPPHLRESGIGGPCAIPPHIKEVKEDILTRRAKQLNDPRSD